jgi:hypothetical protein
MADRDRFGEIVEAWEQGTPLPPDTVAFLIAEVERRRTAERSLEARCAAMRGVLTTPGNIRAAVGWPHWEDLRKAALAALDGKDK